MEDGHSGSLGVTALATSSSLSCDNLKELDPPPCYSAQIFACWRIGFWVYFCDLLFMEMNLLWWSLKNGTQPFKLLRYVEKLLGVEGRLLLSLGTRAGHAHNKTVRSPPPSLATWEEVSEWFPRSVGVLTSRRTHDHRQNDDDDDGQLEYRLDKYRVWL
jgi:hypothetical protein